MAFFRPLTKNRNLQNVGSMSLIITVCICTFVVVHFCSTVFFGQFFYIFCYLFLSKAKFGLLCYIPIVRADFAEHSSLVMAEKSGGKFKRSLKKCKDVYRSYRNFALACHKIILFLCKTFHFL